MLLSHQCTHYIKVRHWDNAQLQLHEALFFGFSFSFVAHETFGFAILSLGLLFTYS